MEHWYPSSAELDDYIARARYERALAVQRFLRGTAALVAGAFRASGEVAAAIGRRRRRRAALAELGSLDDRMLADIGLSRAELPGLTKRLAKAKGPFARTSAGIMAQDEAEIARPAPASVVPLSREQAAHDFRTPLTSIRSFAEILRDNPDLPRARRDQFLGGLIDESERLERAIDRIVDDRRAA